MAGNEDLTRLAAAPSEKGASGGHTSDMDYNLPSGPEMGDGKGPDEKKFELGSSPDEDSYVFLTLFACEALTEASPYPEVQASIPPADNDDLPINTFRAWFLGIVGTMVLTALNQFFQLHTPPSK